jgi:hypothetical protein
MSLIQYQQATYAGQLRDQLELAGCDARVAALVSRVIGELIDHVSHAEGDLRRDINEAEARAARRASELSAFKRDQFYRFIGVTLFIMAVAVVCGVIGVLITLFQ